MNLMQWSYRKASRREGRAMATARRVRPRKETADKRLRNNMHFH